jgi:hypothetical protein
MSLTSYRAAPSRATNFDELRALPRFRQKQQKAGIAAGL